MTDSDTLTAIDTHALRGAFGQYTTGVVVVTAMTPDWRRIGLTANSFTSVSLVPPLISFCVARSSTTLPDLLRAHNFGVNVLAAHQQTVANTFARSGGDKYLDVPHHLNPRGIPMINDTVAQFDCRIDNVVEAGDHVIVLGAVDKFTVRGGDPLVFQSGTYHTIASHPDVA